MVKARDPKNEPATRTASAVDAKIQELYLRRATRFFEHAFASLPREVIEHALAADEDEVAVFELVMRPETIHVVAQDDPLAEARVRGHELARELLQMEGGCGTVKVAMAALDMTKEGVRKRLQKGHLIAISTGKRGLLFPRWQFKKNEYAVLDGLEDVLQKLQRQGCIGWSVLSFFLTPHIDLEGQTPLAALRAGKKDAVIYAASAYGEMGR